VDIEFTGPDGFLAHPAIAAVNRFATGVEAKLKPGADAQEVLKAAVQSGAQITRFELLEPSLNEIFIEKTSMRKIWLIIKREYVTRVKTKGFVIGTLIVPLLGIGFTALIVFLVGHQSNQALRFAIVDNAGGMAPSVVGSLDAKLRAASRCSLSPRRSIVRRRLAPFRTTCGRRSSPAHSTRIW